MTVTISLISLLDVLQQKKKNAVEVYIDDIFPNFASFDGELRMSHLSGIRTSVVPLLEAYTDALTRVGHCVGTSAGLRSVRCSRGTGYTQAYQSQASARWHRAPGML